MAEKTTTFYLALPKKVKDEYKVLAARGKLSKAFMANSLRKTFLEVLEQAKTGLSKDDLKIFGNEADTNKVADLDANQTEGGSPDIYEKSNNNDTDEQGKNQPTGD